MRTISQKEHHYIITVMVERAHYPTITINLTILPLLSCVGYRGSEVRIQAIVVMSTVISWLSNSHWLKICTVKCLHQLVVVIIIIAYCTVVELLITDWDSLILFVSKKWFTYFCVWYSVVLSNEILIWISRVGPIVSYNKHNPYNRRLFEC